MPTPIQRTVSAPGGCVSYLLERKAVKNMNLRVRRDGQIRVSAHPRVPLRTVDDFVAQKAPFLRAAQEQFRREAAHTAALAPVPRDLCLEHFTAVTARLLPLLAPYGVQMPTVKVREMKSRWGSCAWQKGTVTLNLRLWHAPLPCLEYVALHELCHFVHPDHSPAFRRLLTALMPDWQTRKAALERWNRSPEE